MKALWSSIVQDLAQTDWIAAAAAVVAVLLMFAAMPASAAKWVNIEGVEVDPSKFGVAVDDRQNVMLITRVRIKRNERILGVRRADCVVNGGEYALYKLDGSILLTGQWGWLDGGDTTPASIIAKAMCDAIQAVPAPAPQSPVRSAPLRII
jgi:hypothetical protein